VKNARLGIVIALTLLPWPLVWLGMYQLHSIPWTFFLYHGICLLPAVIIFRTLWLPGLRRPTKMQFVSLVASAVALGAACIMAYHLTGELVIEKQTVLEVLTQRGYEAKWMLPLCVYFIVVNATLEELFWRGVILNELKFVDKTWKIFGIVWTNVAFAAWHYLVIRLLVRPVWAELVILSLVLVGLYSSWLYRKYDSILLPILWHAFVFDLAVIVVFVNFAIQR